MPVQGKRWAILGDMLELGPDGPLRLSFLTVGDRRVAAGLMFRTATDFLYYNAGVGSGGPLDRFLGGVFGVGLRNNVKRGLAFLKESLETGKVVDRPDALVSFEELHAIMGIEEVEALEQRFLTAAQLKAKYGESGQAVVV